MSIWKSRLVGLIEYVRQSARLRAEVVSNVTEHGRFLLLEQQLASMDGVKLNDTGEEGEDELWLSVPRPPNPELPPPPQDPWLSPWLALGGPLLRAPELVATVDGSALIAAGTHRDAAQTPRGLAELAKPAVEASHSIALSDYAFKAEVENQFALYLDRAWKPWAEAERSRRRLSRVYVQLFTLQQELSGVMSQGPLELVWGVGLGVWKNEQAGVTAAYPLVSWLVDLTFNQHTGAAEVRPRDVDPRLELDFYASIDHPGVTKAERRVREFFANAPMTLSPFDPGTYQPVLAIAKACLEFQPNDLLPGDLSLAAPEEQLEITDTWVLFARPRSTNLLVQDLERLGRAVLARAEDQPLPCAIAALVTEPANQATPFELPAFRGVCAVPQERAAASQTRARDLYFPQPFNDEQLRIVQLLETFDGVVVQGPPGTGKTHTIANIVCHWLASGRRVLVTAMKDPALAVLREQLPEQIRPLVISLVASERQGLEQLEQSVDKIATEVQRIDPAALARDVAELEDTIDALHARLARIDTDARRWARLNLSRIEMEGEGIDPLDAAQEVVAHAGQFEWIPDPLGVGPQYAPRFSDEDIVRLCEARRQLGDDIEYAGRLLPALTELPATTLLLQAHQDLARVARLAAKAQAKELPQPADASQESLTAAQNLTAEIERIATLRDDIAKMNRGWAVALRDRLRGRAASDQLGLLEDVGRELERASVERRVFLNRPVSVPISAELDSDFVAAVANLGQGKRPFGLIGVFGHAEARKYLESVTVKGQTPASKDDWQHVAEYLLLQGKWRELVARWDALAPDLGLDTVGAVAPGNSRAAVSQFALYRKIQALVRAETKLVEQTTRLFPHWPQAGKVVDDSTLLGELERALAYHLSNHRLGELSATREKLLQVLEGKSGPVVDSIRAFLSDVLGKPEMDEAAVVDTWSALMAELSRLHGLSSRLSSVAQVSERIAQSGAPQYARLLMLPLKGEQDRLSPDNWRRAWRLRRLASHLAAIDPHQEFKKLATLRRDLEHDLARAYHDTVVKRTWLKLAGNATPSLRAALQAYLNAMQRIGKGTGKRAMRYRQDARNAAAEANAAVPCWIMPHHRVSESLPPELGCFDLVVIDEASQSDLSALPALLRAQKLLVVGDDKQISPEVVGLEERKIKALMERFLPDQVPLYRRQMSPERSIYDLASVVFAHSGVMLKEHFRCVPPIIEYSKREFYGNELRPLRLPKPSERLDPPLVDVYIAHGQRENDVNLAEVDYIVEEIRRLVADREAVQRSIGVVSLLGEEQALRIWDRLNDDLGPELLQRHRVVCGDGRTFQGMERDVMFLSLVSAPNEIGAPLSGDLFAQRFNVAASSARDRMYLVRSIKPDQLSEADRLRRGLILHFAQPSHDSRARLSDLRELCESPFERELYDWLVQHGYRVTPQVSAGAYHIDLVVEGARDSRLAVECDGDKHQGPEKWADDMRRQRVLERAGWRFWRCFASSFVRRREAVLEDLRLALRAGGIEPLGARAMLPAVHTIRTEAQPNWWGRDAIGGSAPEAGRPAPPDAGRQAPIGWQEAAEAGGKNEAALRPPLAVAVDAAFGVHRLEAHRKAP